MIGLGLEECKKLGINKVLMTCSKGNIGSAKSITNNGGVFESEVPDGDGIDERYWITILEEIIETKRLEIRRAMPMDAKEMLAWFQDERVYTYLKGKPINNIEDVMEHLRKDDPNSKTQ